MAPSVLAINPSFTSTLKHIWATPGAGLLESASMLRIPISGKEDPRAFKVPPGGMRDEWSLFKFATTPTKVCVPCPCLLNFLWDPPCDESFVPYKLTDNDSSIMSRAYETLCGSRFRVLEQCRLSLGKVSSCMGQRRPSSASSRPKYYYRGLNNYLFYFGGLLNYCI